MRNVITETVYRYVNGDFSFAYTMTLIPNSDGEYRASCKWINSGANKTLIRQTAGANTTVKVLDGDSMEELSRNYKDFILASNNIKFNYGGFEEYYENVIDVADNVVTGITFIINSLLWRAIE